METSYPLDIHVQYSVMCSLTTVIIVVVVDHISGVSCMFLRPIATVCTAQTFQAPCWVKPGNEAGRV